MTKNQTSFKKGNQYWRKRAKANTGRPSKYDPEFCELIIPMGEDGLSVAEMAAEFNVCRQTLMEWATCHADFSTAFARAKTLAEANLYRKGIVNIDNKSFQGTMWTKIMQARFREHWTERRELTGANGGPIQTKVDDGRIADAERLIAELANRNDARPQTGSVEDNSERPGDGEALRLADHGTNEPTATE